jgi:hypothetical protein
VFAFALEFALLFSCAEQSLFICILLDKKEKRKKGKKEEVEANF